MGDQWDPKYPKQGAEPWDGLYDKGKVDLRLGSASRWRPAFQAIVTADGNGAFEHLKRFREQTKDKHPNGWVWRWGLWDLYCWPLFVKPTDPWSTYVALARRCVPDAWVSGPGAGAGDASGLPPDWFAAHNDQDGWRTVWAFKVTALLIAGLIEGPIPRTLGS